MTGGQPSRTAMRVAMRRAAHQLLDSASFFANRTDGLRVGSAGHILMALG